MSINALGVVAEQVLNQNRRASQPSCRLFSYVEGTSWHDAPNEAETRWLVVS